MRPAWRGAVKCQSGCGPRRRPRAGRVQGQTTAPGCSTLAWLRSKAMTSPLFSISWASRVVLPPGAAAQRGGGGPGGQVRAAGEGGACWQRAKGRGPFARGWAVRWSLGGAVGSARVSVQRSCPCSVAEEGVCWRRSRLGRPDKVAQPRLAPTPSLGRPDKVAQPRLAPTPAAAHLRTCPAPCCLAGAPAPALPRCWADSAA
jgi:hypothetical protein